jgi:8-amino-7-oxononanoate synthase
MLERMAARLAELREADQFRDLKIPAGIQLGSNDYLGLAGDPRLKEAIVHAVERDAAVASTGSRLLSGNHERWEQVEAEFAAFVGAAAALYFTSGYSANVGLLSALLNAEDTVFSDAANHASLIDGVRLSRAKKVVFPHLDLNYLENALRRETGKGQRLIVVESLFSMDGDHAPYPQLVALAERFDAFLIIDEAHSIGVDGPQGRGWTHHFGRSERVLATVHTCGKALASMGAFVAGSATLREFLINQARPFIFSTALPAYCAAQIREALALASSADAERAHLRELSARLRAGLSASGFNVKQNDSQIIPVILGSNDAAVRFAAAMNAVGFAVRAIRPPTVPAGSARLRLSLHARLTIADIGCLVHALAAVRDVEVVSE